MPGCAATPTLPPTLTPTNVPTAAPTSVTPTLAPAPSWVQVTLPYKYTTPMATGDKLKVNGTTIDNMSFDFGDDAGNIVFHFNPRPYQCNCVVRNSLQNGGWGTEERSGSMPFTVGKTYTIVFERSSNGFLVTVDDVRQPSLDFTQVRISVDRRSCCSCGMDC